ncbi:MAG: hypothetical protein CDV28_101107 [Candidatus Electronema aureum]|uniref:Uncharacterized protein n=1 Tax=Candidatus Electronema aureum TaxID=2005002 RepID=A0A521G5C7_9BACT|nr:MAG: hypothetical protein CDV28_101107 [Candidatus Electronema aureum]
MEVFRKVAKEIKYRMDQGNYSFITIQYSELQLMYRTAAQDDSIRLAKSAREGIQEALSDLGVRVFPSIDEAGECVRFFRSGTVLWDIVSSLRYPNSTSDGELKRLIKRIKEDPLVVLIMPPAS